MPKDRRILVVWECIQPDTGLAYASCCCRHPTSWCALNIAERVVSILYTLVLYAMDLLDRGCNCLLVLDTLESS